MGLAGVQEAISFSVPGSWNPLLAGSSNFFWAVNESSGSEKNCIVYSLFCVFFIIVMIITIISIISNFFVTLLNCLYLNA